MTKPIKSLYDYRPQDVIEPDEEFSNERIAIGNQEVNDLLSDAVYFNLLFLPGRTRGDVATSHAAQTPRSSSASYMRPYSVDRTRTPYRYRSAIARSDEVLGCHVLHNMQSTE